MTEPSREALEALAEQHARNWGANSNGGTVSMLVDFAVTVARAAKPERERVMSKDELETEMRDLAMTVKVATIESCAKIAEQCLVGHTAEDIAACIRALKRTPA